MLFVYWNDLFRSIKYIERIAPLKKGVWIISETTNGTGYLFGQSRDSLVFSELFCNFLWAAEFKLTYYQSCLFQHFSMLNKVGIFILYSMGNEQWACMGDCWILIPTAQVFMVCG